MLKFSCCEKVTNFEKISHYILKLLESQIISKIPFSVIVSTKIPTKFYKDFCPSLTEVKSKKFQIK